MIANLTQIDRPFIFLRRNKSPLKGISMRTNYSFIRMKPFIELPL